MCPVWKPAVDPPVLDAFCHLSLDAQRVMAAMYTDYQQRRTELLQAQKILTEPRNYYAELYSAKFGSIPWKPDSYGTGTRWPARSSSALGLAVSPVSVDTSRYSDSPPIETQDYRILSQFHRAESTTESPGRESVIPDDTILGSQCLFSQDSRTTANSGTNHRTHRHKSHGSYGHKNYGRKLGNSTSNHSKRTAVMPNNCGKFSTKNKTISFAEHNGRSSIEAADANVDMNCQNQGGNIPDDVGSDMCLPVTDQAPAMVNIDDGVQANVSCRHNPAGIHDSVNCMKPASDKEKTMPIGLQITHTQTTQPVFNLDFTSSIPDCNCTELQISMEQTPVKVTEVNSNICMPSYDLSDWPTTDYQNGGISGEQDKAVLGGLWNVCMTDGINEQGCNTTSKDTPTKVVNGITELDDSLGENRTRRDSCNMTCKDTRTKVVNVENNLDHGLERLAVEDESPISGLNGSIGTSGAPMDMTGAQDESPHVTPSDVYDIFKHPAITTAKNLQDINSRSRQDRTSIHIDNSKKRVNKSKGFAVPLKKSKPTPNSDRSRSVNKVSATRSNIADISTIHLDTLTTILSGLLDANEVILSLVYSNDSTQLRDGLFSQDPKKRQPFKQKLGSPAVKGFAVASKSANHDVFLFPATNTDRKLHTTYSEFWRTLMVGSMRKVGFNAKDFFTELLRFYNFDCDKVDISWTVLDPSVALWLLDPDKPVVTFDQVLMVLGMPQQAVCDRSVVALHDDMMLLSVAMGRLYQQLGARGLWDLYVCVETKLIPLLAAMELRPFHIATHTLLQFSEVLKKKLSKLEQQAHVAAGHSFLLTSHPQLRQVLFEELRLDARLPQKTRLAKTSVGHQTSTSETVLTQLSPFHELPGIVLEYRQLQKLKSTYIDGILSCVQAGVLYPHWDQTAAATGRLTAYQPNIQAIPKVPVIISGFQDNYIAGRDEQAEVELFARDSFVSRPGWSLLAADFQQIELRLLAHLADDEVLLQIFSDPDIPDIFNALTAQWLGKPVDHVTAAEREQTKRVVYSVMYGAGKEKLAEYLKISTNDAKSIITSFLLKFPAVSQFTHSCVEYCQKNGYTCSIFKRRRLIPNIQHPAFPLRAQAERQAVNFCVQGSAADICKAAMIQVEHCLAQRSHIQARLLVQIHDELLLEVADSHLDEVTALVKSVMENQDQLCGTMVRLRVPIPVSISTGKTWGHMTTIHGTTDNTG